MDEVDRIAEIIRPYAEWLGIPIVIIVPIVVILLILFKVVIPYYLKQNTTRTAKVVRLVLSHLFGEGDGSLTGFTELNVSKLLKEFPDMMNKIMARQNNIVEQNNLLSKALMAERLIKPATSQKLRRVIKLGNEILSEGVKHESSEEKNT